MFILIKTIILKFNTQEFKYLKRSHTVLVLDYKENSMLNVMPTTRIIHNV